MNKNKKQIYMIVIFVSAFVIGIGYALLNSTLNITGNTKVKENSWDVHFENFSPKSGSVTATSAGIDTNKTSVNYTVTLQKPGDFYEFEVDAVNKGSIDAMINTISNTGLTAAQKKYMTYSVSYSDGTEIAEKQELPAKTGKETIKVRVEYKKDITASDLPETNQTLTLTFSVNYVQADGSSIPVTHPVCRRATTLHTEICEISTIGCAYPGGSYIPAGGYEIGDTITYGNLGATGTLAAGDAFDCDVNGDGTFDAATERFYYVSELNTNSNYGVLIYYNDVSEGNPNNTARYVYDSSNKPRLNGPQTLKNQLPTTSQWKNVSLYNTTRKIKDERENEYIDFDYSGYAARLVTYQEVVAACGTGTPSQRGYFDKCKYLLENTKYTKTTLVNTYWTETLSWSRSISVKSIESDYRATSEPDSYGTNGVRPVIEVPKSKISY